MENLGMLYVDFKKKPLISSIRTKTKEVKDSNIEKQALKSNFALYIKRHCLHDIVAFNKR